MNRKLNILFTCLLLFLFASQSQVCWGSSNLSKLVRKVQPAVVTIITYHKNRKGLGQGSGFFIDRKGHLITNYHVVKGGYKGKVRTYDGKEYSIKSVLAANRTMDIVKLLIHVPHGKYMGIPIVDYQPDLGDQILVVGSPMGLEQTVSDGIISGIRKIPNMGKVYQISAPISPGSSGSPVINMKGEVIGVASFSLIKGQNLNFAIPGKCVLDLLNLEELEYQQTISKDTVKRPSERESAGIGRDSTYIAYADGVVRDTNTGLEWKVGPDKDTNSYEARQWVQSLNTGGGAWRMPTIDELKSLYKRGKGSRNMTPSLKTTGWWVWSGETFGSATTTIHFYFYTGFWGTYSNNSSEGGRAFAVRKKEKTQVASRPAKPLPSTPASDTGVVDRDGVYVAYANGIVRDTNTGLEWKVGPDKDTTWNEARSWVQSLNLDGGGWRMPTMDELVGLYKEGVGDRNMTLLLKTTGWAVWSGETKGSSFARHFIFDSGYGFWKYRRGSNYFRAFAVRSRSDG